MWKKIRKSHKDGKLWMLCIEGEDESVDIGRWDAGRWITVDDSPLYPDGLEPTHVAALPKAAARSNVVSINEFKDEKVESPESILAQAMEHSLDSVVVLGTNGTSLFVASSSTSVPEVLFIVELAKAEILRNSMGVSNG